MIAGGNPASASQQTRGHGRYFINGVALNLLNPTIFLIWLSVLSLGTASYDNRDIFLFALGMCAAIAFISYAIEERH